MWNTTHNIFYIANVYAEIIKVIENHKLTYGDWDCLQNLLEYGVAGSNKNRSDSYPDLVSFTEREPNAFSDKDYIKYSNVFPESGFPIFDTDDYFIQKPCSGI